MAGNEDKDDALAEKAYAAAAENTPVVSKTESDKVAPAKGVAAKSGTGKPAPLAKPAAPIVAEAKAAPAVAKPVPKPVVEPEPAAKVEADSKPQPVTAASVPPKPVTTAVTAASPTTAAVPAKPLAPKVAAKPAPKLKAPAGPKPKVAAKTAVAPKAALKAKAPATAAAKVAAAKIAKPVAPKAAAKVKIITKPALTKPAITNPTGAARVPVDIKPALAAGTPGTAKAAPASAAKSGPAPKTGAANTSFAGLISNFMLEDTTMDMSANFSAFQDAVTEAQAKAKAAFEKSSGLFGELGDFTKGNVEAVVESGKILAEGLQGIGSELVAEGRTSFATMTGDIKELAAVKSPTDFFKLQGDILRKNFDTAVAYGSKNSETFLKLFSDVAAPISGRVSVAMEKARHVAV